jgi:hypothetical protein
MRKLILLAIPLFLHVSIQGSQSASSADTELARLAALLQPGTWAELKTVNIKAVLGQGQSSGNRITYSNSAAWDSVRGILHFIGKDAGPGDFYHVEYVESSNSWVELGTLLDGTFGHGYDHNTVDVTTGTVYHRVFERADVLKYPIGGPWSRATSWPGSDLEVAIGTCWWTGMFKGAGAAGALIVYNSGVEGGEVQVYDPLRGKWFGRIAGFGGTSTYHAFAECSAVHNVAIFGGGNDNPRKVWRLNQDRTVTVMSEAPVDLGIQRANVTVDPVTGNFLIMGYHQLWEYNPTGGGTWTQQRGTRTPPEAVGNPGPPDLDSVISAPIPNYGVTMYVTCFGSTCNVHLYKHASAAPTSASSRSLRSLPSAKNFPPSL